MYVPDVKFLRITAFGSSFFLTPQTSAFIKGSLSGHSVFCMFRKGLSDRLTDLENELMAAGEGGGGTVREFGMDMHTLLYLKQITIRGLLYSTGNSTQCCMAAWMGAGLVENGSCICLAESLCHLPEIVTILVIGYTSTQNCCSVAQSCLTL